VADPTAEGWTSRALPGFFGLVGPLWTKKEGEAWAYAFLAEEKHTNPAGIVHGGMLTTLLDHTLSVIAWEANERNLASPWPSMFISRRGPPGRDLVAARGRIVRQTSSLVFTQGSITVQEQEIATASAILKIK
jgi:acyl-coenzyme A thioesterase PaaI-like protein